MVESGDGEGVGVAHERGVGGCCGNDNVSVGDYFPPKWEDGNYAILEDGKDDPQMVGVDGIKGTAPVGSFKPNALGFYDLGGNVWEWMWDGLDEKTGNRVLRGVSWDGIGGRSRSATRDSRAPGGVNVNGGLRLVRRSGL